MSNRAAFNIIFFLVLLAGIGLALTDLISPNEQSEEGHLMAEACKDIQISETLRAEADIDEIIRIIETHVHRYDGDSHQTIKKAVEELRVLKDEAVFRNTYPDLYTRGFTHVLNQLSYITLMDALESLKEGSFGEAMASIEEAQTYLHDALVFSKGEAGFDKEMQLLHQLNHIKRDPSIETLQGLVTEVYQLI